MQRERKAPRGPRCQMRVSSPQEKKMYIPGLITWTNSEISICASPGFCIIFSIDCDPAASNVESS